MSVAPSGTSQARHPVGVGQVDDRVAHITRHDLRPRTDTVRAAQSEATQVWLSELRLLLSKAEERFADVSWTTTSDTNPSVSESIWAHKAILYARAPNTFHARFLQVQAPKSQLNQACDSDSLAPVSLHATTSYDSVETGPALSSAARKPVRGAPPSSFSLSRKSLSGRSSISTSVISRPFRNGSTDDAGVWATALMTSDSENEGSSSLSRPRKSRAAAPSTSPHASSHSWFSNRRKRPSLPLRKPSFASSNTSPDPSSKSEVSSIQAPRRLEGISSSFFKASLQQFYTAQDCLADGLEFLFDDKATWDADKTPEKRLERLRSDLIFMWRSKLYSDIKLSFGSPGASREEAGTSNIYGLFDIPDASTSIASLPNTLDTKIDAIEDEEDDESTTFSVHRMILASRSPYFASLLLSPYADSSAPVLHLPAPPFTAASLHFALGFLYTGTLFFSNRTFDLSTAFAIWRAGAYLQVATLQRLIVALIERDLCHSFTCSPPCRKCIKRVPRTLAFSVAPDVSESDLLEAAICAVAGPHFGLYWAKEVGNLDPILQNSIVGKVTARLDRDPACIVSVLRQLAIVGQKIDIERASPWVESLRSMAELTEAKVAEVLHANVEQIFISKAWSDLLDGIGNLGDVLEKCLVLLLDGLTEANAAKLYESLVGQVLLRSEGIEIESYRQAVENTRASILRYLKKRWVNIRALSGFNNLPKWCLKEIADELDLSTSDLLMPEEPRTPITPKPRSTIRTRSSLSGNFSVTSTRGTGSNIGIAPNSSPVDTHGTPRATRRTSSVISDDDPQTPKASVRIADSSASATSSYGRRQTLHDESLREAGPIHLRAAVLNRNAARASVVNGHRASDEAIFSARAPVRPPMPKRTSSMGSGSKAAAVRRPLASVNTTDVSSSSGQIQEESDISVKSNAPRSRTISARKTNSVQGVQGVKVAVEACEEPSQDDAAPTDEHSLVALSAASGSMLAEKGGTETLPPSLQRFPPSSIHTAGESSNDSAASAAKQSEAESSRTGSSPSALRTASRISASDAASIRTKKSASSLQGGVLSNGARAAGRTPSLHPKSQTSSPNRPALSSESAKLGPAVKTAYLRATPGPGGTFSLSSTDSGRDIRARTISGAHSNSTSPAKTSASNRALKPRQSLLTLAANKPAAPPASPVTKHAMDAVAAMTASKSTEKAAIDTVTPHSAAVSPSRSAVASQDDAPLTAMTATTRSLGTTKDSEFDFATPSTSTETMLVHRSPLYNKNVVGVVAVNAERKESLGADLSIESIPNGVMLHQAIPCIVYPQNLSQLRSDKVQNTVRKAPSTLGESLGTSLRRSSAQNRFQADVKYVGAVHGCQGVWVGLEVALPLPTFLQTTSKLVDHDGSVEGKRYFSLSHQYEASTETDRSSSVLASAGSRTSSGTYAGTGHSQPKQKRQYQYPETASRRERRHHICQMASTDIDPTDPEPTSTLLGQKPCTTTGIFVRPEDILLIVGGW